MDGAQGVVGLSDALIALREELLKAQAEGQGNDRKLRFRIPEPIELEFQAAVTKDFEGNAGIRWWLVSLGGQASRGDTATHTVRLKLSPVIHDADTGEVIETVEIDSSR
jgi:Trypsin-co-occurring domain 2